jgi:hypothetical protein
MATKREFLVGLGLAKAGARGRFSAEGQKALDEAIASGVKFDEPVKPEPKPKAPKPATDKVSLVKPPKVTKVTAPAPKQDGQVAAPIRAQVRVRPQNTLYAITPVGRTHARIGYDTCFNQSCAQPVCYCTCKGGPKPPAGAIPVESYPKV